ncbi:hypothetical protein Sps_05318 [Shewanella psychrophila]|uniref:Uncharacterized protein n=1 Tax=Shewanella psychrophila TaxID=225848 RepID=A0A1S6HXT1_9GAMM|nr:hypothetical protein Sps_05318 [Shewanella psychrophila]
MVNSFTLLNTVTISNLADKISLLFGYGVGTCQITSLIHISFLGSLGWIGY